MNQNPQTIWIVVLVESGIPVSAEAFQKQEDAVRREQQLREDVREAYDEVGLFETPIAP
jgi:hypothetical protein